MFVDPVVAPCRDGSVVFASIRDVSFLQDVIGRILRNVSAANAVVGLDYRFRASDTLGGTQGGFAVASAPAVWFCAREKHEKDTVNNVEVRYTNNRCIILALPPCKEQL